MVKVLIVSDSPALDTGFGRVAREIGTGLHEVGFEVCALAWSHQSSYRLVPFQIVPVQDDPRDNYGELTFGPLVESFKPDVVLTIGDFWMVDHITRRPRNYRLIGYVPIDSMPASPECIATLSRMDDPVLYGNFGRMAVQQTGDVLITMIPHGVDCDVFRPVTAEERLAIRHEAGIADDQFLIGTVARNNTRKMLPRLLKAFKIFIAPEFNEGRSKKDAVLYLHTDPNDHLGHRLLPIIKRLGLEGRVAFPKGVVAGHGLPDPTLAKLYNSFDLFTLPTAAEGWGLPILEAMACGVPVLVTAYGGHTEFVNGVAPMIPVSDFITDRLTGGEHAIVDLQKYVQLMDRFYYSPEAYTEKWGEDVPSAGLNYRLEVGEACRRKAQNFSWNRAVAQWVKKIADIGSTQQFDEPSGELV